MIHDYGTVGQIGYVMREGRPLWVARGAAPPGTRRMLMSLACGNALLVWKNWAMLEKLPAWVRTEGLPGLPEHPPPSAVFRHEDGDPRLKTQRSRWVSSWRQMGASLRVELDHGREGIRTSSEMRAALILYESPWDRRPW